MKMFKTNEEAMLYAKNNPGTVITRNADNCFLHCFFSFFFHGKPFSFLFAQ